jgi:hypothetical protein
MSDEIIVTELTEIVYQRGQNEDETQPEFKPGNTPHTQYGDQVLNANVPWDSVVQEILNAHYTQEKLAKEVGIPSTTLGQILKQNYDALSFRIGARILGVHFRLFPEMNV